MGFFEALSRGLERSREALNEVFYFGGEVDEDFWENLEDTLVMGDMGAEISMQVTDDLRDEAARRNLKTARQLRGALADRLSQVFVQPDGDIFRDTPSCVLFVGINGAGKTTTVGKIASDMAHRGKKVVIGSADTFRAAAIDQLKVWADRAGATMIRQEMGSDPASVAFDTLTSAKANGADVVLIDTAGRLHNKVNLMNELTKIRNVMGKVIPGAPHEVMLVLDGSTGQNAFEQARQFTQATQVTSLTITKLDGTAKGGVVIGISDQFHIPVRYIGIGEGIDQLRIFDRKEFVNALFGHEKN